MLQAAAHILGGTHVSFHAVVPDHDFAASSTNCDAEIEWTEQKCVAYSIQPEPQGWELACQDRKNFQLQPIFATFA